MILRSKSLLMLWDPHQSAEPQGKKKRQQVDGRFVFDCLFSVAAVASNPKQKAISEVAQALSEQQLVKLRACRDEISKRHGDFINQFEHADDLTMNQYQSSVHQPQELSPDDKKYTPQTVMLIKVFQACDAYFNTLYFAHMNGELTHQELSALRKEKVTTLRQLLAVMVKSSMDFHKMKKQIKGES